MWLLAVVWTADIAPTAAVGVGDQVGGAIVYQPAIVEALDDRLITDVRLHARRARRPERRAGKVVPNLAKGSTRRDGVVRAEGIERAGR